MDDLVVGYQANQNGRAILLVSTGGREGGREGREGGREGGKRGRQGGRKEREGGRERGREGRKVSNVRF